MFFFFTKLILLGFNFIVYLNKFNNLRIKFLNFERALYLLYLESHSSENFSIAGDPNVALPLHIGQVLSLGLDSVDSHQERYLGKPIVIHQGP